LKNGGGESARSNRFPISVAVGEYLVERVPLPVIFIRERYEITKVVSERYYYYSGGNNKQQQE